ncbi:hypothetical protein J2Z18_006198 [Paenibacillus lactis]|uniref:Uncharacterized protein n=1 Tax=Paenibacillus lactis TaxID=228574 RepID=A0ABS4FLD5_9BACL|nr:hypothetical protein [Paenibacillus lactis]
MSQSFQLVFKYFFSVGSGLGLGLIVSIGIPIALYLKFREAKPWQRKSKKYR